MSKHHHPWFAFLSCCSSACNHLISLLCNSACAHYFRSSNCHWIEHFIPVTGASTTTTNLTTTTVQIWLWIDWTVSLCKYLHHWILYYSKGMSTCLIAEPGWAHQPERWTRLQILGTWFTGPIASGQHCQDVHLPAVLIYFRHLYLLPPFVSTSVVCIYFRRLYLILSSVFNSVVCI